MYAGAQWSQHASFLFHVFYHLSFLTHLSAKYTESKHIPYSRYLELCDKYLTTQLVETPRKREISIKCAGRSVSMISIWRKSDQIGLYSLTSWSKHSYVLSVELILVARYLLWFETLLNEINHRLRRWVDDRKPIRFQVEVF